MSWSLEQLTWAVEAAWFAPALGFGLLGGASLLGARLPERLTAWVTRGAQGVALVAVAALVWDQVASGGQARALTLGHWFAAGHYHMPITALLDPLSVTMAALTVVITALIGHFSVNYLHREAGFQRFFLLTLLFQVGMTTLVLGGSYDLLFLGWELVGLTSVLLIAFFFERTGPVLASLRALATYRSVDIGLLFAMVLVHQLGHSAQYVDLFGASPWGGVSHLSGVGAGVVAAALLLASMGKSAQAPLGEWLPRAMEGPTPSSALFYGGLSVHAGVYLLLRSSPLLAQSPLVSALVVLVGAVTAVYANITQSVQSDVKGALGYATMTQAGLMFVAVGLGFYTLATVHLVGHAILRTAQLLRSPSALREMQRVRATHGGQVVRPQTPLDRLLSPAARDGLYRVALDRFYLDALLARFVMDPLSKLALALDRLESRWLRAVGRPQPPASSPPPAPPAARAVSRALPADALTQPQSAPPAPAEALALRTGPHQEGASS